MGAYIKKACCRSRGACFRRTRGGGRSIGRAVVFFSRAFRAGVPKVKDFFAHKDNHSDYLCALRTKKARRSLHISAIQGRFFLFIVRIVRKTRHLGLSSRGQRRESLANVGRTPRSAATARGLHPRTSCVDDPRFRGHRALFLHGEQAAALSFAPRWGASMHKNGQTADGHTGCQSAVWPLLDRDRRAVAVHCGGRHRHRAMTRGGA